MSGIFISYRRDDSGPMARRLYELLCAQFGPAVVTWLSLLTRRQLALDPLDGLPGLRPAPAALSAQ